MYAVIDCPDRENAPTSVQVFHDRNAGWQRFRELVLEDLENINGSLEEMKDAAEIAANFDAAYKLEDGDNIYECGCSYIAFLATGVSVVDAASNRYAEFSAKLAAARAKHRPPIKVGEKREFHSTLKGEDSSGVAVRTYSGQTVEVLALAEAAEDQDEPGEDLWRVRAEDGVEFAAWECELNGFIAETDQTIWPAAATA